MKPREWWICKGTSNFCQELETEFDSDPPKEVRAKPEGFYDVISTKDTVEGGVHVIEFSAYDQMRARAEAAEAANKDCISSFLHAQRIAALEADVEETRQAGIMLHSQALDMAEGAIKQRDQLRADYAKLQTALKGSVCVKHPIMRDEICSTCWAIEDARKPEEKFK